MSLRIPYSFAKSQGVCPGAATESGQEIWVRRGAPLSALAEVRRALTNGFAALPSGSGIDLSPAADAESGAAKPLQFRFHQVSNEEFERRMAETYSSGDLSAAEVADDIGQDIDFSRLVESMPQAADLLERENDAPIIRLINALLTQAVREQASDIHIESFERHSVVRFRQDGMLRDVVAPHPALHTAMVSRIKVMADLDIAERRLPQDGRITVRLAGRAVDIRVSTLPTGHGERVVLRLLDKNAQRLDLAVLGMAASTLKRFDRLISQPHGIVLVTGPTGSGKTTTLYAGMSRLDTKTLNIMTVEDPVEFDLPGIGQTQVNPRIDLTFATILRAILRQDPDIIMIGEIRDYETAQIAVQASLTGHLVLATLHTNDAASAVTRMVDMGVEPFLLASSLIGVLAQRLVRKLCPHCRVAYLPTDEELAWFAHTQRPAQLYRPAGCPQCNRSGYLGRTGVYELLDVDDTVRRLIHERASDQTLAQKAAANGFATLFDDGLRWLASGDTSVEELLRVTKTQGIASSE